MTYDYDLIVIGGGSAGLSIASVGARLGVKVALIDAGTLGGDCLHYGCVPSKTLIRSAKIAHMARTSKKYGIQTKDVSVDFPSVMQRVREVISHIQDHADNADRFRKMGCDVWINTTAAFTDSHTVDLGETTITGKKIAICAGSRPRHLKVPGLDEVGFLTNETVFSLTKQPKNLLVIGSGPIGSELAQAFQRLGTQVTLINRHDTIMDKEDEDVRSLMKDIFKEEGIDLRLGIDIKEVKKDGDQKVLIYERNGKTEEVRAEAILVGVGRVSNADQLQCENAGVELDERGYIKTNTYLQTTQKHIYAAGDITGHLQFTHSAAHEAGVVISNALLHLPSKVNLDAIPWATFTDPEVASCGLNESFATKKGIKYTMHKFPLEHQDRALAEGRTEGFVKLLLDKKNRLLGCQIVAPHAGELIHEWIVALNAKLSVRKLSRMVHVYPTLAMANQQAGSEYFAQKFFTPRIRKWLRFFFGYRNTAIDS